MKINNV